MSLLIRTAEGSQQTSLFSLRNLGGMLLDVYDFLLSSATISLSTAATLTGVKANVPTTLSLINLILG